jgi:enoyl-CoA hydratase/carnithine racemase
VQANAALYELCVDLERIWKPVIAAPHGYAMGLALDIVLECDLIVAAAGTKFRVTETSRGLGGAKYWALLDFKR